VFSYRRVPGSPTTARQLPVPADDDQRRLWDLATGRTYVTGYTQQRGAGTVLVQKDLGATLRRQLVEHRRGGRVELEDGRTRDEVQKAASRRRELVEFLPDQRDQDVPPLLRNANAPVRRPGATYRSRRAIVAP
jgi:hypothetical protein